MIPDGLDPDDYIRKYGGEKFRNDIIDASVTLMTFKMNFFRRERIYLTKETGLLI